MTVLVGDVFEPSQLNNVVIDLRHSELKTDGVINEEDFEAKKQQILGL